MGKKILITGVAGFIGFHVAKALLQANPEFMVHGFDNLNSYYDVDLKKARLNLLTPFDNFIFHKLDLTNRTGIEKLFAEFQPDVVVHLAAQAGVRYSVENPHAYTDSNVTGFLNILEGCRNQKVSHLIFASTSSVYGANTKTPFNTKDAADHPVSLYAATKKANEMMAHSYAHMYGLPCTGLRFFTVYGPWGRPDMALFKFIKSIYEGKPIDVYNNGKMRRDFTYVDDVVGGILRLLFLIPSKNAQWSGLSPDPSSSDAPYKIYNIGNSQPEELMDMIHILEEAVGKKAAYNFLPLQTGDVLETSSDTQELFNVTGFKPSTSLRDGIYEFVAWYKSYFNIVD